MDFVRVRSILLSLVLTALSLIPAPLSADGGFFSEPAADAASSDQKAIIIVNGRRISITYSTAYTGDGREFAWVIPVPVPPGEDSVFEAGESGEKAFEYLESWTAPELTTGGGCFTAGTPVLTDSGYRPIESLSKGDIIAVFDTSRQLWTTSAVTRHGEYGYNGDLVTIGIAGSIIEATGNHPFLVLSGDDLSSRPMPTELTNSSIPAPAPGRWVEARHLRAGDILVSRSEGEAAILGLETRRDRLPVYHMEVSDHHTYAVSDSGIVVHNGDGSAKDGGGGAEARAGTSVTVYGQIDLGDYRTAILGAKESDELLSWLQGNGYQVSSRSGDVLGKYIADGWAFVALKLQPDGYRRYENEFLTPVTVQYRHGTVHFPLRISAVSTSEPAGITLYLVTSEYYGSPTHPVANLITDSPERMIEPASYIDTLLRRTKDEMGAELVCLSRNHMSETDAGWGFPEGDNLFTILSDLAFDGELPETGLFSIIDKTSIYITRLYANLAPEEMDRDIEFETDRTAGSFKARIYAEYGWGPDITIASFNGDLDDVTRLLDEGADLEARDYEGQTALLAAASAGHVDVVRLLMEAGAEPGFTMENANYWSAMAAAAFEGHIPVLEFLLESGIDVDSPSGDRGQTALFSTIYPGRTQAAAWLLTRGADPNHADKYGERPLRPAVQYRRMEILRLLLEAGADPDLATGWGMTIREYLEEKNETAMLQLVNQYAPEEKR